MTVGCGHRSLFEQFPSTTAVKWMDALGLSKMHEGAVRSLSVWLRNLNTIWYTHTSLLLQTRPSLIAQVQAQALYSNDRQRPITWQP